MSGIAVIRALMGGDDALSAVVEPVNMVGGPLPSGSPLPALAIEFVSGFDRKVIKAGSTRRVTERIQVTFHTADDAQRDRLAPLVKNAGADAIGDFAGVTAVSVQTAGRGPDFQGRTGIRMGSQDFIVSYNEATGTEPVYDPDAAALWARRTTPPTTAEMAWDEELILGLKADGIWAKLDILYIRAQSNEQAARLNYVKAAFDCIAINSPTFLRGQGFIGDGVAAYLDTGFDPGAQPTAKYKAADAHLGVWLGTDISSATQFDCGHNRALILGRNGLNAAIRSNQTAGVNFVLPSPTSIGWLCWSRDLSTSFRTVKNDGAPAVTVQAAAGIAVNMTFLALAANNNVGLPGNHSPRLQLAMHAGGNLTDAELPKLYARIRTRLQRAGAI